MPSPDWYHPIDYTDVCTLRSVSIEARWVFFEIFNAELGEKTGLVCVRPALIAAESGLEGQTISTCIDALVQAGAVVFDAQNRMAYHAGHLLRHPATNAKHAAGWRSQIERLPAGCARDAALSELSGIPYRYPIDRVSIGYPRPPDRVSAQEQEQEQEQEQRLGAATAPPPDTPPPSLPAVPAQGVLTMPTPRPAREPPPRVQAALLAQTAWNSIMAPPNAKASRLDGADITVVGNAVEYVGGIEAMRALMAWAITDDWFGGRSTTNPWTIRSWCARGTLDAAQAKRARGPAQPHRPAPKFGSVQHMDQLAQDYRAKQPDPPVAAPDDCAIPF